MSLGLIGLILWAGTANSCLAREAEDLNAQSDQLPRGIRDPLNPEAYMRELAERLNTSQGKKSLMRGLKTQPSAPSARVPAARPPVIEPLAPAREAQIQPRILREEDLRRMIAEELSRQRQPAPEPTLREQDLRALIAQEVNRQSTTVPEPTTPAPSLAEQDLRSLIAQELDRQSTTVEEPTTPTPSPAEQDLRSLIAQELDRRSTSVPQPDVPASEAEEPAMPTPSQAAQDLRAMIAQLNSQDTTVAQPDVPAPDVEEPTAPTPSQAEQDLRTLIAQELNKERSSVSEPTLQVPEAYKPTVLSPSQERARRQRQAQDLQALIAQELSRQQPGAPQPEGQASNVETPTAPTPSQEEPDLPTLIAQELQRRRQRAAQPSLQAPRALEPRVQTPSVQEPRTQELDLPTLIAQELQRRRQQSQGSASATSGVSPVTGLAPDNRAAIRAYRDIQVQRGLADPDEPWTLEADLDKYRAHAVAEGSRNSGESLKHAMKRIGLALEDGTNIITLGYASDRGVPFRTNDGKGLFQQPGNVPKQAGKTIGSLGDGLYSLVDLATFDALSDKKTGVYQDNNPLVRPLIFTGRAIGGVWKTTEEIGNAVTWGYFDNVTGSIGMCFEDIIEVLKHTGQAVTNIVRAPLHLIGGKDKKADKALDWVLLVPLELASNIVEMKGFSNMDDYETAFAEKGVIGSILEFGGSTFIVYTAVDELIDELEDNNSSQGSTQNNAEAPAEPPATEPTTPPVIEPEIPTGPTQGNGYLYFAYE